MILALLISNMYGMFIVNAGSGKLYGAYSVIN